MVHAYRCDSHWGMQVGHCLNDIKHTFVLSSMGL